MNNQRKNNLQVVLEEEHELKEWFTLLMQKGRKYNYAVNVYGDEKIEVKRNGEVDVIILNAGLDRIKEDLISLQKKYPL